jgi:hypothetical protein
VHRPRRLWGWLSSVLSYQRGKPTPLCLAPQHAQENWSSAQNRSPQTGPVSLRGAQCTGRESPNGNASATHAARNAAPEKWSGPNPRQTYRTQAIGCLRRGIALQLCAQERLSSGPYCTQFPYRLVTASMVRKDSPALSVEKLRNADDSLVSSAAGALYDAPAEFPNSVGL